MPFPLLITPEPWSVADNFLTLGISCPKLSGVVRLELDGFRWELAPAFASKLGEVLAAPARVIKESPAKLVTVQAAAGSEYYVKRYRHTVQSLRPLKFLFKPSQARQEWRLAERLAAKNIAIVRHVGLGERWRWRGLVESILITEAFPGRPLNADQLAAPEALAEFVGRLHDQGILQRDLHPGNILVNPATGEWRLVDLHGIEIRAHPLPPRERAENLAFLRVHYPVAVSSEVLALSGRRRREYLRDRSWRCLKHNREFGPKRAGGLHWRVRWPWLSDPVAGVLEEPDAFLTSRAHLLKAGRSATVGCAEGLVLKRYNLRKRLNLLKDLFRPSKARRAFRNAYHLELTGIATARPIATADRRWCGFVVRSFLLMEEIPEARPLSDWAGDAAHAARAAGRLIAQLHNEGFSHRDLKETNLVFDGGGRLFLIDLEGLHFLDRVPLRRAVADLQRLARAAATLPQCTAAAKRIFLRIYCQERGLRPAQLRSA